MVSTIKIIRTSIHTFLSHYNYFTYASILALPFSASILISNSHLHSLFDAPRFPSESQFFSILNLKLSQTISSSLLILPFSLSFLLLAKATVIQSFNITPQWPGYIYAYLTDVTLNTSKRTLSISKIFSSILPTHIWNTIIILSVNITCFWILFISFNFFQNLHIYSLVISIPSGIIYSIVITNALITCNLAIILSGMELNGGFFSILKACIMIRGRTTIALALSLPVNMALAGIESLFQFRVIKAYSDSGMNKPSSTMVLEGLLIAYLYSVIVIIDTIVGCVFFKSCIIAYDRDEEAGMIKEKELELGENELTNSPVD